MTQPGPRTCQTSLILLGLTVTSWTLLASHLWRPDGFPDPIVRPWGICGLALVFLGVTWATHWRRCAALSALAVVGQAFALELVSAPPYGVYQHYLSWRLLLTFPQVVFLLGLIIQTVILAWVARDVLLTLKRRVFRLLTPFQMILTLFLMAFAGVAFSRDVVRSGSDLVLAGWVFGTNLINLVLVAESIPSEYLRKTTWLKRCFRFDSEKKPSKPNWDRLFPWLVAGWTVAICSVIVWFVFERVPHIPDSVAYLFQAKYFSSGQLHLPAPPVEVAFEVKHTINDGEKWYGIFPPGWPAVLAVGVWFGVPWLVNPLLAGFTVLLTHVLVSRLFTRQIAHMTVGLLGISPMFLFTSASFMSHTFSVVCSLVLLLGLHKTRTFNSNWWATVAGLALGTLVLTRPIEGVIIGTVTGLWALRVRRLTLSKLLLFGWTSVAVGSLLLPYNYMLTGNPIYDPITKSFDENYYPGSNRLGFGQDIGNVGWPHLDPLPGHGILDVIINANKNTFMFNVELFGWAFGSLVFVFLLFVWWSWRREDWLLLSLILATIFGYSFYWFSGGPDFGARYWYQALIPLVILTSRGIVELHRRWEAVGGTPLDVGRISGFVIVASLIALVNFIPWRSLGKYRGYRGMNAEIQKLADIHHFGHSLVFIKVEAPDMEAYDRAFVFNPPTLDLPGTIYARDTGATDRETVRRHFSDRRVWFVGRSSPHNSRLQVLAGPLSPSQFTKWSPEDPVQALHQ